MREEIADLVYPVVSYGLDLKARLERGERPDFAAEQAELRNRLKNENEARRWPEYGGDGERYLGIRYALTCWLDEVLIDSPWDRQWNERKLEEQLYFSNERAERFWQQADLAQGRAETDAVEAFYLCVMLGFRGEGPVRPQTLHGWRDAVEDQLSRGQGKSWPGPQEMQPDVFAPPRRARDRLRLVLMGLVGLLAVIIPWVTYLLVKHPLSPR
jgi:type VI secretion system protein ImpK